MSSKQSILAFTLFMGLLLSGFADYNYLNNEGVKLLRMSKSELLERAQSGEGYAESLVGIFYRTGELDFPIDAEKSLQWTNKALDKKHPVAMTNMGSIEMDRRNIAQANYYYQEAFMDSQLLRWAENGDPIAAYCLGIVYSESNPKNYGKAIRYFTIAAEEGLGSAQAQLSTMYFVGMGISSNPEKALQWSELAMERGTANAYFNLGIAYSLGQGVDKDLKKAFQYLKTSAEKGFAQAQLTLGMKYVKAHGVDQDYMQALKWFKTALSNGMIEAKGPLMKYSIFVSEDELKQVLGQDPYKPSVQTVQKSETKAPASKLEGIDIRKTGKEFEQDFVSFTLNIPKLEDARISPGEIPEYETVGKPSKSPFVQGKIEEATKAMLVEKDFALAEKLLRNLALQGDPVAQRNLGELYFSSENQRTPNTDLAYEWLEKAATQGDVLAQRYVGMMFFIGNGPVTDYNVARKWLTKAANQGDNEAKRQLKIFKRVFQ
jgi:TPR repeat protein